MRNGHTTCQVKTYDIENLFVRKFSSCPVESIPIRFVRLSQHIFSLATYNYEFFFQNIRSVILFWSSLSEKVVHLVMYQALCTLFHYDSQKPPNTTQSFTIMDQR